MVGRLISSGKDERKVKGGANGKEKDREMRGPVILNDNDRVRDIYGDSVDAKCRRKGDDDDDDDDLIVTKAFARPGPC